MLINHFTQKISALFGEVSVCLGDDQDDLWDGWTWSGQLAGRVIHKALHSLIHYYVCTLFRRDRGGPTG